MRKKTAFLAALLFTASFAGNVWTVSAEETANQSDKPAAEQTASAETETKPEENSSAPTEIPSASPAVTSSAEPTASPAETPSAVIKKYQKHKKGMF